MRVGGLVHRDLDPRREALYRLSERGESLAPVHHTMSAWHRTHLPVGRMAEAERIEDTLDRLRRRHTTTVIQILDNAGPMRYVDIAERAGLGHGTTSHRLARLQTDGLVTRTGQRFGDPYVLTDAGQALGAVYATVERWSEPLEAPRKPSAPRAAMATRTHHGVPRGADDARTTAALQRSAVVPTALFSHAPQPQPRGPAALTAESAPNRAR
ncbi:winged helix-turn-helix transcriptional regulator [Streptomyces albidoflavus]